MSSSRRLHPLTELARARLLEFLREPEATFWVFIFPIGMALALGFAFRDKAPEPVAVGITGQAQTSVLREAMTRSALLKPRLFSSLSEGRAALRTGKIALLIENGSSIVYWYDPTRPDSRLARFEVDKAVQEAAGRRDAAPVRDELVSEKGSRYIDFLMPGLLGLNLLSTSVWGIGYSIVNARIKKTLKLMTATPMRRSDFLLAQMLSRFVLLALEAAVIVAFGMLVFQVPLRGSPAALALLCVVCGLSFGGSRAPLRVARPDPRRRQRPDQPDPRPDVALLRRLLLAGAVPEGAPGSAIQALPLTAANEALRAVMLEGRSLATLPSQLAILAVWGIVSYVIALKIFRWQ